MHMLLVGLLAIVFVTPCYAGRLDECLSATQSAIVTPSSWTIWAGTIVKDYASSFQRTTPAAQLESMIRLRAQLVDLQARKARLITIVEAHVTGTASGVAAATNISVEEIPFLLTQIRDVINQLDSLAARGDRYVVEGSYKQLKIELDVKRTSGLCGIANELAKDQPDREALRTLKDSLNEELKAISEADDELARYIRERLSPAT